MLPSPPRILETIGTSGGIFGLLLIGVISGVDFIVITLQFVYFLFEAEFYGLSLTAIMFTFFILLTGGYMFLGVWRNGDQDEPQESSGPEIHALIPAYRESRILDTSVKSLLESTYSSLKVVVVVEPDDVRTRDYAQELARDYEDVECLVNGQPGSKARAINYAVSQSTADYFAVFDADEKISSGFIAGVMRELRNGADVVQGRRIPRPDGVVETLAYCERFIVQAGYACAELLGFTHCQSSSTGFTREAFEAVGGYDDQLTEDIGFSHKCYRANLTVVKNRRLTNTMEAPHTFLDLWGQRKRWRMGHVQVFDSRIRESISGDFSIGDILSVSRAAGGILGGAFLMIFSTHVFLLVLFGFESAFLIPYASLLLVIGAVWYHDYRDGYIARPSWHIALAPLVLLLHGILTVKALTEYYLTWEGEWYRVTKTGG